MANKSLGSAIAGPFIDVLKGDKDLDSAVLIAQYNAGMALIVDVMADLASSSKIGAFLFSGWLGQFVQWLAAMLIKRLTQRGYDFVANKSVKFVMKDTRIIYQNSMSLIIGEIEAKDYISFEEQQKYRNQIKGHLKQFFNLSKFFKKK